MQRDKVIGVHNSVNQSVQNYSEIHITIVANIQVQPIEQKNAEMMIDVQEGQLLPTLLSNDEESIHEIQNLGQIENIKHKPYRRILVVKHLAWNDTVASLPSLHTCLDAHVRAKHHLNHIVRKLQSVQVRDLRRTLHDSTEHCNKSQVSERNGKRL